MALPDLGQAGRALQRPRPLEGVLDAGPQGAVALKAGEGGKCHANVSMLRGGCHSPSSPPGLYKPCSVLTTETKAARTKEWTHSSFIFP